MKSCFKRNKRLIAVCLMLLCSLLLLVGCKPKDNTDPNDSTPDAPNEYFEPAYSIFEPESAAEKYIYLGAKIRAGDWKLYHQLNDYSRDEKMEYEYKFIRGPGHGNVSKSVPFLTLVDEVPENVVAAERSITLDFNHELYSFGFEGIDHRVTYNPMITDKWTLKNNSDDDIKIKAAYPFSSYSDYINIYLDDGVRHSVPSFDVSGADADISYAVAPVIQGYPNTDGFTPYDIVRQKLQSGYYLKEALADDWKADDEIIIYDITINREPENDKHASFYFTIDPKKTMVLQDDWQYGSLPLILKSDDPDLSAYGLRVDNKGRYPQRLVILGDDVISKGFIIIDENHLDSGEIIELPEDEFTIERTTSTVDDYYLNEGTAMRWIDYTYESYKDNMPVEVYRQWIGYVVKQSLIDYFTSANHAADDDPLALGSPFYIEPLVYYIAEFTIPANGEVTLDISYMDRNAIYNFLCPDDPAYDLGKTEITVIKNDNMIIMDQNLGFKTKGNKLTEDVSTMTFDTLKPGLYFEYRDYWARS